MAWSDGAKLAAFVAFVALVALAAACGGAARTSSDLPCLVTLESECCTSGNARATCIGSFGAAEECSSWAASTSLAIFATPCAAMTAVRATLLGSSYASFYVYDASGALYAIGDNATSPDPASETIECGAGPSGYVVPSECAAIWVGTAGATPCTPGTTPSTSICR